VVQAAAVCIIQYLQVLQKSVAQNLSWLPLQVKAQGPFKLAMFNAALRYKQFWMSMGYKTTQASPLCNKVFFSKTQVRDV
jgi:hypothetical protein